MKESLLSVWVVLILAPASYVRGEGNEENRESVSCIVAVTEGMGKFRTPGRSVNAELICLVTVCESLFGIAIAIAEGNESH